MNNIQLLICSGIVPPLAGVGALNAVLFGTYSAVKRQVTKGQGGQEASLGQVMICGWISILCIVNNIVIIHSMGLAVNR